MQNTFFMGVSQALRHLDHNGYLCLKRHIRFLRNQFLQIPASERFRHHEWVTTLRTYFKQGGYVGMLQTGYSLTFFPEEPFEFRIPFDTFA